MKGDKHSAELQLNVVEWKALKSTEISVANNGHVPPPLLSTKTSI